LPKLSAVITIARTKGRETVDAETRAASLEDLYSACRDAPPSKVTRISVRGPDGELRLNFASFIRKERG
jgi:hypothetical protein